MAPSSATQFRATPATVQSVTGRSRETFKLTPQQPLTANRSGGFSSRETHRTQPALKRYNPARPWARGRPQRGGAADKTPAPADWQPTPNRCKRPWGIDPRGWSMVHRITGESDRRHLSRGPMSAAIEQSLPYASYLGQPAPSNSIANQSKKATRRATTPGAASSQQRARGVAWRGW